MSLIQKLNKVQKGSILVEALLSIVILSISITLIIQALTQSMRSTVYSSEYTVGIILLENKIFELMRDRSVEANTTEEGNFDSPFEKYRYVLKTGDTGHVSGTVVGETYDKNVTVTTITSQSDDNQEGLLSQISLVNLALKWTSGRRKNNLDINTLMFVQ